MQTTSGQPLLIVGAAGRDSRRLAGPRPRPPTAAASAYAHDMKNTRFRLLFPIVVCALFCTAVTAQELETTPTVPTAPTTSESAPVRDVKVLAPDVSAQLSAVDATEIPLGWASELRFAGGGSIFGAQGTVGARFAAPNGIAITPMIAAAFGTWYVGGYPSDNALTLGSAVLAEFPLLQSGQTRFSLRTALGGRSTGADDFRGAKRSFVATADIGLRATIQPLSGVQVYLGFQVPLALAVSPDIELEELTQIADFGADIWVTDRVALTFQGSIGGTFGYNGDGAKAHAQANLGLRVALNEPHLLKPASMTKSGVGLFVATEWRANGLAAHLSHGMALAAGVSLFDRHLKLGLIASSRPGPFNPTTFQTALANGATYKGQSSVSLRSDGGGVGLLVAPAFGIPKSPFKVELPLSIGYAAYGFYLNGDERKVPDDRRVSTWESELFDGRDAAPALSVDAGAKLSYRLPGTDFVNAYVAGRYAWNIGYDSYVTNNYDGPSLGIGIEIEN